MKKAAIVLLLGLFLVPSAAFAESPEEEFDAQIYAMILQILELQDRLDVMGVPAEPVDASTQAVLDYVREHHSL